MTRGRAAYGVAIAALVAIVLWRIPALRASGNNASELRPLLGRPVPASLGDPATPLAQGPDAVVYYVYSEECPFCGMDRAKVRRAALGAGGGTRFEAVSLGKHRELGAYWAELPLPPPDGLRGISWQGADSLGIEGVPLLVVAHGGIVRGAWIGHLEWTENAIRRGIECRSGRRRACAILFLGDVFRGVKLRAAALAHRAREGAGGDPAP